MQYQPTDKLLEPQQPIGRHRAKTGAEYPAQKLLTLQSASTAIASTLDLDDVLHTVAREMIKLLEATGCIIYDWNQAQDTITIIVEVGPEAWHTQSAVGSVYQLTDYPLTKKVLQSQQLQQMTFDQPEIDKAELTYLTEEKFKSLLILPLVYQGRTVGLLEVADKQAAQTFAQQDIELAQLLTNQAANAIENAKLYAESRRRLVEQAALLEAGAAISATLDLDTVLHRLAEQMGRAVDATSAYIGDFDTEAATTTVLAEYFSPEATKRERISDLGVTYSTRDFYSFVQILKAAQPRVVHADDLDLNIVEREHFQDFEAKTELAIPLRIDDQIKAYALIWESRYRRDFSPREIALVQGIAQQAAIALNNAQLHTEMQQRTNQLAMLLESTRTISSTLNLETILKHIAQQMIKAADASGCTILQWDRARDSVVTWIALCQDQQTPTDPTGTRYALADYPATRNVLETRRPFTAYIDDPKADRNELAIMQKIGVVGMLMLPLIVGNQVIGLVEIEREREKRAFLKTEIELCQALVNQAAVAIQNAHLLSQTQQHLAEQIALRQAGEIISSTLDLETVLSRIAEQMGQAIDVTSAYISIYNPLAETITVRGEYVSSQANAQERVSDLGISYSVPNFFPTVKRLMESGQPDQICVDDPGASRLHRAHLEQYGGLAELRIPLIIGEQFIGLAALWDSRETRCFTPEEIAFCQSISQQAAIAIQNAQLYEQVQHYADQLEQRVAERTSELTAVNASLQAQIAERERAEAALKQANAVLQQRVDELATLNGIIQTLTTTTDLAMMLDTVARNIVHLFQAQQCGIALLNPAGTDAIVTAAYTEDRSKPSAVGQTIPVANNPSAAWLLKHKQPLLITDPQHNLLTAPIRELMRQQKTECMLLAPLLVRGELIGMIGIDFDVPGRIFTPDEVKLAETIAGQVAGVIDNARLLKEEQQRRQIAEGLREVSTALSSSLDQVTVLGKILELLSLVLNYDNAGLFLQKDEALILVSAITEFTSMMGYQIPLNSEDPAARVFHLQQTLIIPDLLDDPGWEPWADDKQIRTWMGTPLLANQKSMGVLTVDRFKVGAYGEVEAHLLRTFADQASLAIQNAYLFEREQHQRKIAESLREVSAALNRSLDQETVLNVIFDQLKQVIHYDGAGLFLKEKEMLVLSAGRNLPDSFSGNCFPLNNGSPTVTTFLTRQARMIPDVHLEPSWHTWPEGEPIRSWMGAPMIVGTEAIGILTSDNHLPNGYSDEDLLVLQLFANQAAIAIQNAQLYAEAQQEIAERTRAEAALIVARDQALEASRLKSELLAKVSHELRTPLGAILGYTEMLQEGVFGPISEKQYKTTEEIVESSHYLTNLVNELLDQAQLDAGRLVLRIGLFSPVDLIDLVQSQMRILAEAKGITLKTNISPDLPNMLSGDSVRIRQIMVNLISNAIKFTATGTVEFRVFCPDDSRWAIKVSDTGPGIPPEAQIHIFEPFRQVDGSITREHGGTGLGLSIVKQLVTLMGGDVILDSKLGYGSTFTVILPQRPDHF